MASIVSTPIIGASLTNVWKPPTGVTGSAGDKYAPFALGTPGQGIVNANGTTPLMVDVQFCRVGSDGVGATGNTGITNGVTTGATGVWDNQTGVALVEDDYVFLTATPTVT